MGYAYLDASGVVIALGSRNLTLTEAQAVNDSIVSRIVDAPEGLICQGSERPAQPFYHKLLSGDGLLLEHYEEIESISCLQCARLTAIDQRTDELIAQGFEFPPSSGQIFSLSLENQSKMIGSQVARNDPAMTWPIAWNTLDDQASVEIANATTMNSFYLVGVGTVRAHIDSGTTLKSQIRSATTKAEIDAIIDNR